MAFVADGSQWCFDGWHPQEIVDGFEKLLERVSVARDRNETVWIGDDLQTRHVLGALDLWSLFSPIAPIQLPAEIGQELAAWLGRAPHYADEKEWPDGLTDALIRVDDDAEVQNDDLAWAHHWVRAGRAVACLCLTQSGPHTTVSRQGVATVHWIQSEADHRAFWRSAVDVEGDNQETLERLAPHAFPDLYFHINVWRGVGRFGGGYAAVRGQLRRYLSVLDDHGCWAFTHPPPALHPGEPVLPAAGRPSNQVIERRFHGFNLDMAPENPDVHSDGTCRRAREIELADRTLYCEWHGKLERHRNRIYIHEPVPEAGGKVVIAFFHEHLPLP